MLLIGDFIKDFNSSLKRYSHLLPWEITQRLPEILLEMSGQLQSEFETDNGISMHKTAMVEKGAILKAPVIIGRHCFIGANAYLRGGVLLNDHVKIGTGCEIKTSIIFSDSAIAHFNFIGDSIIGSHVNFEAGSVTANHFNEREDKNISVVNNDIIIETGVQKFGTLAGDGCKIGANAVLSPGTILAPGTIVKRLELIDQLSDLNSGRS